jgi:hypothetical protein
MAIDLGFIGKSYEIRGSNAYDFSRLHLAKQLDIILGVVQHVKYPYLNPKMPLVQWEN